MKRKTVKARDQRSPANIRKDGKESRRQPLPKENFASGTGISVPTGWNGKLEYLGRSSVCSQTFPVEPRVSFAFKPVERKFCLHRKHPGLFFILYSASSNGEVYKILQI